MMAIVGSLVGDSATASARAMASSAMRFAASTVPSTPTCRNGASPSRIASSSSLAYSRAWLLSSASEPDPYVQGRDPDVYHVAPGRDISVRADV